MNSATQSNVVRGGVEIELNIFCLDGVLLLFIKQLNNRRDKAIVPFLSRIQLFGKTSSLRVKSEKHLFLFLTLRLTK